ncbi:MAG: SDR family NAD(P)-dependent oxidoreductase [Nanoarchaeota archaeon]
MSTVLITGSSKGLGAELARVFAEAGWDIILHGRNMQDLQNIQQELSPHVIDIIQGDIRETSTIEAIETAARKYSIDVFINNAGIGSQQVSLEKISDKNIDEMLLTNLISPIKLTQRIYRFFTEKKLGTIININSMSGREQHHLRTLYCASKWGLRGFSDTLKREAKDQHIRVLDIYPTMIKTSAAYPEGMETKDVANKIFTTYQNSEASELVIDGRPLKAAKKKVLICGATGFIGRNIAEALLSREDIELYGTFYKTLPWNHSKITFLQADLTQKADIEKIIPGMDIIIQAAATTSGAKDIVTQPYIHVTNNAVMNSLIFRAAHDYKVKHVVFFSCSVMYQPSETPVKETDFNANHDLVKSYFGVGWTKVYIEKMCEFYSRLGTTKYTVLRHSNIYGPHDKFDLDKSHVFGATMTKVLKPKEGKIIVWGTGEEERDLLYVSDLVNGVVLALEKQQGQFGLYNLGYGKSLPIRELVKKIVDASSSNLNIEYDTSKPTIKTILSLDCTKAKQELGWQPSISLEEGIRKTLEWYRKNILS